jgi:hypothetical protein
MAGSEGLAISAHHGILCWFINIPEVPMVSRSFIRSAEHLGFIFSVFVPQV